MDFKSIIDLSVRENEENLMNFMQERLSDEQQRMFARSFYLTYFNTDEKYPIDGEDAMKWLGYIQKHKFKAFIIKHLKNDDEFISLTRVGEQDLNENLHGGHNKETIKLTVDAFKKLGMEAGTKQGEDIRNYYIALEKVLFEYSMIQASLKIKESNDRVLQLENEVASLSGKNGSPVLYIYSTDIRDESADIKTGCTENAAKRIKPFKQTHPFGRLIYKIEIPTSVDLRQIEKWIQHILLNFRVGGEVFNIPIDEVKLLMIEIVEVIKLYRDKDSEKRVRVMTKIVEILLDEKLAKINVSSVETQTDSDLTVDPITVNNELYDKFEKFVEECCIINEDAEVGSTDIIGKFRLWSQTVDKQVYHQILDYLARKFKPCRLRDQNKDQVVNGFRGVDIIRTPYKLPPMPSDIEIFLFQICNFNPSGKVLQSQLISEYAAWKKRANKPILDDDEKELKTYLKNCKEVLPACVWSAGGNGTGYYGLNLKSEENFHKQPSTTAKKVEKRDLDGNYVESWTTIAKAAEAEGIAAAKLSRMIKNKVKTDSGYYITV